MGISHTYLCMWYGSRPWKSSVSAMVNSGVRCGIPICVCICIVCKVLWMYGDLPHIFMYVVWKYTMKIVCVGHGKLRCTVWYGYVSAFAQFGCYCECMGISQTYLCMCYGSGPWKSYVDTAVDREVRSCLQKWKRRFIWAVALNVMQLLFHVWKQTMCIYIYIYIYIYIWLYVIYLLKCTHASNEKVKRGPNYVNKMGLFT